MLRLQIILTFITICTASIPRKYHNGYYFPGKNCGISNPIRYLNEVPNDIDGLQCAFVLYKFVKQGTVAAKVTYLDEAVF